MEQNMIGAYGPSADRILGKGPAALSYRQPRFTDLESWRAEAKAKARELVAQPDSGGAPQAEVVGRLALDGVEVERLRWELPYGPATEAVFLKPEGSKGPLPGVLALHDHGGNKYFGYRKIADDGEPLHPMLEDHRARGYSGRAWANELARRGYAVLCHDTFSFASRRVRVADVPEPIRWDGARDVTAEEHQQDIDSYNQWAGKHENIMAKSLHSAGTTWPGMYVSDDQRALDLLCARPEVDAARLGCCGLSGGGVRSAYLGGLDDRIACAIVVGMMTTWRDLLLYKCWTHTWMFWASLLPKYLDYPEVFGLRVPRPAMVLNNTEDPLFTLSEMERADGILREVYQKAGVPERYACNFHPGTHKFDQTMQEEAFAWFDRWLKPG